MMKNRSQKIEDRSQKRQFKRSILVSLLGHLALFSIFGFSFGEKFIKTEGINISFYGAVLDKSDVVPGEILRLPTLRRGSQSLPLTRRGRDDGVEAIVLAGLGWPNVEAATFRRYGFIKPKIDLNIEKKFFANETPALPDLLRNKRDKSAIMVYPGLPFYFSVYFNDRHTVHIEVMFKMNSDHSISMRRKISSGNLEVDLLVMRYLSHYLFIQQNKAASQDWHTVQIDFSPK